MSKRKSQQISMYSSEIQKTVQDDESEEATAATQRKKSAQLQELPTSGNTQPVPLSAHENKKHDAAASAATTKEEPTRLLPLKKRKAPPVGVEEQELAACLVALSRSSESPTQASAFPTISSASEENSCEEDANRDTMTSDESDEEYEEEKERKRHKKLPRLDKSNIRDVWEDRFQELTQFKSEFGHANPRVGMCPNPSLAQWLKLQRQVFRSDLLDPAQTRLLRSLGCEGFEESNKYSHIYPTTEPKKVAKAKSNSTRKPEFTNVPEGPPNIPEPNSNDVVCGRGASIYKLPGNVQFRSIVASRKLEYIAKPDNEKMPIAQEVIAHIRNLDPPGRFIMKHKSNGMWYDVGDKVALKKTAMTLRQDARAIREADAKNAGVTKKVKLNKKEGKQPKSLSWQDRYHQLLEFKHRTGHANPTRSKASSKDNRELYMWLSEQRKQFRQGTLPIERIQALLEIGSNGFGGNIGKESKAKQVSDRATLKDSGVALAATPKIAERKKMNAVTPEDESHGDGFGNSALQQPKRRRSRSSRSGVVDSGPAERR